MDYTDFETEAEREERLATISGKFIFGREMRTSSVFERPPGNVYIIPEGALDEEFSDEDTPCGCGSPVCGECMRRIYYR